MGQVTTPSRPRPLGHQPRPDLLEQRNRLESDFLLSPDFSPHPKPPPKSRHSRSTHPPTSSFGWPTSQHRSARLNRSDRGWCPRGRDLPLVVAGSACSRLSFWGVAVFSGLIRTGGQTYRSENSWAVKKRRHLPTCIAIVRTICRSSLEQVAFRPLSSLSKFWNNVLPGGICGVRVFGAAVAV